MTDSPPRRGRPRVTSREVLEKVAFDLLLRDGYEATTVQAIMTAGGVSRTTFFRYFGSKGGIVWGEFDRAIENLRQSLGAGGGGRILPEVIEAVVSTTRMSREAAPDTWLDRFRVLDQNPALAGETAEHWRLWAAAISEHVAERTGLDKVSVVPASIGGAIQAAYVSVLRVWGAAPDPAAVDLDDLHRELGPLGAALQALLE